MTPQEQLQDDRAFYFDFLKAQVQVIAQRNQFLLFFQSILFASMGVLLGKDVFFPLWLYVNALTHTNESRLEKELRRLDERFVRVASERKRYPLLANGDSAKTVAFFFPSMMIVAWFALLGFYLF